MAPIEDQNVPHESEHAAATDAQMRRTSDHAAIDDVAAVGSSYVQAEVNAIRAAVNEILDVLRDAELIPPSA